MATNPVSVIDARALRTLTEMFWTRSGWRDEASRSVRTEEFEHGKRAGVMFDPIELTHDEALKRLVVATNAVDYRQVVDAFVASLSSRRLDLRSALGSYAVMRHLTPHAPTWNGDTCSMCGARTNASIDLNVLSFERFKWGGVRHDHVSYAAFDLEQFSKLNHPPPRTQDVTMLRALIDAIERSPLDTTAAALEKRFLGLFPSNKSERAVVVGIFGMCGVLGTEAHAGYIDGFVPASHRPLPLKRFVDTPYPACWWSRANGISYRAIDHWFGHLL